MKLKWLRSITSASVKQAEWAPFHSACSTEKGLLPKLNLKWSHSEEGSPELLSEKYFTQDPKASLSLPLFLMGQWKTPPENQGLGCQ